MSLNELTQDQKTELKQSYLCTHMDNPSWSDMAEADERVTDEQLEEEYGNTDFVNDDFLCSMGE